MRPSLNHINPKDVCAEIGVWQGVFSKDILKCDPSQLHLIDPWVSQYPDRYCLYSCSQDQMDNIFEKVQTSFLNDERVFIHREFSNKAKFKILFDWVYIDGDHSYETVKEDLNKYYSLIKKGGFLCGHDYTPNTHPSANGGPLRAVNEFIKEKNLEIIIYQQFNEFVIIKQ